MHKSSSDLKSPWSASQQLLVRYKQHVVTRALSRPTSPYFVLVEKTEPEPMPRLDCFRRFDLESDSAVWQDPQYYLLWIPLSTWLRQRCSCRPVRRSHLHGERSTRPKWTDAIHWTCWPPRCPIRLSFGSRTTMMAWGLWFTPVIPSPRRSSKPQSHSVPQLSPLMRYYAPSSTKVESAVTPFSWPRNSYL